MHSASSPSLGQRLVRLLRSRFRRVPVAPRLVNGSDATDPGPRTTRQRDGDEGERLAREHLERAGLVFVAANVRYRDGELDLVMREPAIERFVQPTLVFVEVRRRHDDHHGGAAASVTFAKRRRLVAAAAHYLARETWRPLPPCRFDVVTLQQRHGALEVCWLQDAFRGET